MTAGDIIVIRGSAAGRRGNYFDGTDDYVLHDAHAVARVAANDTVGTYSAWIFLDDISSQQKTILSAGDNDSATEYLQFYTLSGKLFAKLYHGGAIQWRIDQTTTSMVANKWYHVAVVQNGTQPVLYIDGIAPAQTATTSTDLTMWYDELTGGDKFAIGILESNNTHTTDFKGAIGQVKYWPLALNAGQIKSEYDETVMSANNKAGYGSYGAPVFNITMAQDGITDAGTGEDNGSLTGHAYYGGEISDWSYRLQFDGHITGHAAEFINTFRDNGDFVSVLKKGD